MDMSTRSTIFFLIAAVMGLLVVFGFLFWKQDQITSENKYDALLAKNASFAEAEKARQKGNFYDALQKYEQSKAVASSEYEEGEIAIRIAIIKGRQANFAEAIGDFKSIIQNSNYPPKMRAYAVRGILHLVSSTQDPSLSSIIFDGPPFDVLFVSDDLRLSYRHVAEYGSSLYPLAGTELQISSWYAKQLPKSSNPTSTDEQVMQYKKIIKSKIASADQDIERIKKQNAYFQVEVPTLLTSRAISVASMELSGDPSLGTLEEAFSAALQAYRQSESPYSDGYARFYYAAYLVKKYGDTKKVQVVQIIAPLYQNQAYKKSQIILYLTNAKFDAEKSEYASSLAMLDPNFKAFLKSLGWTENDFQKS